MRLECINGLDYYKVIFRKEVCDLIRDATLSRVDYISYIEVNHYHRDIFTVYYMSNGVARSFQCPELSFSAKHFAIGKKISEFYKMEQREAKLKELGI